MLAGLMETDRDTETDTRTGTSPASRRAGIALSLAAALGGAVALVAYKAAGERAGAAAVVLAAMLCAALLNSAILGQPARALARVWRRAAGAGPGRPGAHALPARAELALGAFLALCTVAANLAVLRSLASLNPALTSVLAKTEVLLVAALAWPLLGERMSLRFGAGALLAVAGIALMHEPGALALDAGSLWAVAAAAAWALMHVVARKHIHRVRPGHVNGARLWLSAATLLLVPGNVQALAGLDARTWLLCGVAALAGPFLARLALLHAVRHLSASHSTLLSLPGPVFAAVLALAIFGVAPSLGELAGAALVLAGVALPARELTGTTAR